jgi:hypothetical protein
LTMCTHTNFLAVVHHPIGAAAGGDGCRACGPGRRPRAAVSACGDGRPGGSTRRGALGVAGGRRDRRLVAVLGERVPRPDGDRSGDAPAVGLPGPAEGGGLRLHPHAPHRLHEAGARAPPPRDAPRARACLRPDRPQRRGPRPLPPDHESSPPALVEREAALGRVVCRGVRLVRPLHPHRVGRQIRDLRL